MSNNLDFMERLRDYINGLNLVNLKCSIGTLKASESLCIQMLPGSATVRTDMAGNVDKKYNILIAIKSKENEKPFKALLELGQKLENLQDLPSKNNSYEFEEIKINSDSNLTFKDEKNFYIYSLEGQAFITI